MNLPTGNNLGTNQSGTTNDFRANMMALRQAADSVASSLSGILGRAGANTPFGTLRPNSADADVFTIRSSDNNRLRHVNTDDFFVDVLQTAQAQRNVGASLQAGGRSFAAGSHSIALDIDGRRFDINFTVGANDTNRDVQNRIAQAVNSRNIGVSAVVENNAQNGTSALVLQSRETGIANAGSPNFTVLGGAGNALSVAGVGNITQHARNAEFRVSRAGMQGAVQTSRTNDVSLGFGIEATLTGVGNADINMERDNIGQINALRSMVNSFNDMIQAARDNGTNTRLERDLGRMARTFSASLGRAGIFMNRDGWLDINEERMEAAAERGDLDRLVSLGRDGRGAGFVGALGRLAENVGRNPQAFAVDNSQSTGNFRPRSNANFLNQMNRMIGVGMLFDTFR
jgi:flagellar hook-associated protein 2